VPKQVATPPEMSGLRKCFYTSDFAAIHKITHLEIVIGRNSQAQLLSG